MLFGCLLINVLIICLHLPQVTVMECSNVADITSVNKNQDMMEGDIMLSKESLEGYMEMMMFNPFQPQSAVTRSVIRKWPGGVVPYELSPEIASNPRAVSAINSAIEDYADMTCIKLIPRTTESNYVRIIQGNGCFSFIGRIGGGQDLSIGIGCEFKGIVLHEMLHALGRWHEQSRPDRDSFVVILTDNVQDNRLNNFVIAAEELATTQDITYDYSSVMHYGQFAFSKQSRVLRTIRTIDPTQQNLIGQRQGLSTSDTAHVNKLYNCIGKNMMGERWSSWGQWSNTCSLNCRDYMRMRTRVCEGGDNCQGSGKETQTCGVYPCDVSPTWGSWTEWNQCLRFSCDSNEGYRQRSRQCVNGNSCPGMMGEFEYCTLQPCTDVTIGEWSTWSQCSATCGGGVRERERTCEGESCNTVLTNEMEECGAQVCPNLPPITAALSSTGCYMYMFGDEMRPFFGGSYLAADVRRESDRNTALQYCAYYANSLKKRYYGMIEGTCVLELECPSDGNTLTAQTAVGCMDGVGSMQNGMVMNVYEIVNSELIPAQVVDPYNSGNVLGKEYYRELVQGAMKTCNLGEFVMENEAQQFQCQSLTGNKANSLLPVSLSMFILSIILLYL